MTCVMENDKRSETIEKLKKVGKEEFLKMVTRGQALEEYAIVREFPPEPSTFHLRVKRHCSRRYSNRL